MKRTALERAGFASPAAVRIALNLPPLPKRQVEEKKYVLGDQCAYQSSIHEAEPLMLGLALAGYNAEQIAPVVNCSPSCVKGRLREVGLSSPRGRPPRITAPRSPADTRQ